VVPTLNDVTGDETSGGVNSNPGADPNENDESEIVDALLQ
jgi:hypothetical protein